MRPNRRAINYFGSKVSRAHLYPEPRHDLIVEPFAGGAGYSLLHHERDVVLVDASPDVAGVWRYLIAASPDEIRELPLIRPGEDVRDLEVSDGGRLLISWCLNQTATPRRKLSSWAVYHGDNACYWGRNRREQCAVIAGRIKHWQVHEGDYRRLRNYPATWFVDPPYIDGGKPPRGTKWKSNYPHGGVDHHELGNWCQSRLGQVIVCERYGADWLPFRLLYEAPTGARFRNGGRCQEALWTNDV